MFIFIKKTKCDRNLLKIPFAIPLLGKQRGKQVIQSALQKRAYPAAELSENHVTSIYNISQSASLPRISHNRFEAARLNKLERYTRHTHTSRSSPYNGSAAAFCATPKMALALPTIRCVAARAIYNCKRFIYMYIHTAGPRRLDRNLSRLCDSAVYICVSCIYTRHYPLGSMRIRYKKEPRRRSLWPSSR